MSVLVHFAKYFFNFTLNVLSFASSKECLDFFCSYVFVYVCCYYCCVAVFQWNGYLERFCMLNVCLQYFDVFWCTVVNDVFDMCDDFVAHFFCSFKF